MKNLSPQGIEQVFFAFGLMALAGTVCLASQGAVGEFLPPLADGQGWKLVWSDEFEGSAVDQAK